MQIHKATADQLGIKQNKDGFYDANAEIQISLITHQVIMSNFQSELKAYFNEILDHKNKIISEMQQEIDSLKKANLTECTSCGEMVEMMATTECCPKCHC